MQQKTLLERKIWTQCSYLQLSKDIDEQLKLALKVVDVTDPAKRKICVTLVWYIVDKPESSYAQVRIFARKKEDEKFQQVVYVKSKIEEFIYSPDVMNSVYNKVSTNQPICNVLKKVISSVYSWSFFFHSSQDELEHWR